MGSNGGVQKNWTVRPHRGSKILSVEPAGPKGSVRSDPCADLDYMGSEEPRTAFRLAQKLNLAEL